MTRLPHRERLATVVRGAPRRTTSSSSGRRPSPGTSRSRGPPRAASGSTFSSALEELVAERLGSTEKRSARSSGAISLAMLRDRLERHPPDELLLLVLLEALEDGCRLLGRELREELRRLVGFELGDDVGQVLGVDARRAAREAASGSSLRICLMSGPSSVPRRMRDLRSRRLYTRVRRPPRSLTARSMRGAVGVAPLAEQAVHFLRRTRAGSGARVIVVGGGLLPHDE